MFATGLEHLLARHLALLHRRRVGLVTHPAAVLPDLTHCVDALRNHGIQLTAIFGPEHGLHGSASEGVAIDDSTADSGIPVYSLYGATSEPTAAMLRDVDLLLFDMQDVGTRYYTYLSTLFYALRAAGRAGLPLVVLDRPNPLGGLLIEGGLVEPEYRSMVGIAPLPIRHGLTLGEAAGWLNASCALQADLHVVPLLGWQRATLFGELGRAWVPTSPAMAHLDAVALYPGICLIEGTNLSVGRGTALPFEIAGAPWLDGVRLARHLNACDLAGVRFRAMHFTPTSSCYAGQECAGVQVHVTSIQTLKPVRVGLELVSAIRHQHPDEFLWDSQHFDRLAGSASIRLALDAQGTPAEIAAAWHTSEQQFREERMPFLRY